MSAPVVGSRRRSLTCCWFLLLAHVAGCGGGGSEGESGTTAETSDTAETGDTGDTGETGDTSDTGETGEPEEPEDCLEGCEPNDFNLEHVTGLNLAGRQIHVLYPPCEGEICPEPASDGTYGVEPITACELTPEAMDSAAGAATYCKLSALSLVDSLELGFTLPPEADTITLERPSLDDPDTPESYIWRAGIVELHGPGTNYTGKWIAGLGEGHDTIVDARNLACIENLDALAIPYDPNDLDSACAATFEQDGLTIPLRTRLDDELLSYPGRLDTRSRSCDTPNTPIDDCCSACDYELGVSVPKYGVDGQGVARTPNDGSALTCFASNDRLEGCREFVSGVDRSLEPTSYRYAWDGAEQDWPLPAFDKLRETHPDDRPAGVLAAGGSCSDDADCHESRECIGQNGEGDACKLGDDCAQKRCVPGWFVECRADQDTTGAVAHCVDVRFREQGAGACHRATAPFAGINGSMPADTRLAYCDSSADANLSAAECCQDALGGPAACDPFTQSEVEPLSRFDRDPTLPAATQCYCADPSLQDPVCEPLVELSCAAPLGDGETQAEAYATSYVTALGGVRYDAELDGFTLRIAHRGDVPAALVESCAENRQLIEAHGPDDGWLAHSNSFRQLEADFDVGACSSSSYTLFFAGPFAEEHIEAEAGFTLEGKRMYTLETAPFGVVPDSGFPTDNLLVSACDEFSFDLSNKYDLSRDNLRKIAIWRVEDQGGSWVPVERVAGGRDCDPDASPAEVQMGAIPCLTVSLDNQARGVLEVFVDFDRHGQVMVVDQRYRVVVPGVEDPAEISDPAKYVEAFHDVCGMPLVLDPGYDYEVNIDVDCN